MKNVEIQNCHLYMYDDRFMIYKDDGEWIQSLFAPGVEVYVTVQGTGPCLPEEAAAIRNIINATQWPGIEAMTSGKGANIRFTKLLEDPLLDPCNGISNIFCENGHIVGAVFTYGGASILHTDIGILKYMTVFDFANNNLITLPESICLLTSISTFVLDSNVIISLPECISEYKNIKEFSIPYNQITNLPNLGQSLLSRKLNIQSNKIPLIPFDINTLPQLVSLLLNDNEIEQSIPSFNHLNKIIAISISNNKFYGTLSTDAFDNLPKLTTLKINGNNLQGSLPIFQNTNNLVFLDVSSNHLHGSVPSNWQFMTKLATFLGDDNLLECPLTPLRSILTIRELSLSHNMLTSSNADPAYDGKSNAVMNSIGHHVLLIDLSHNLITGPFQAAQLQPQTNTTNLDMSYNQITSLPLDLFRPPNMQVFDFSYNQLEGSIPDTSSPPLRALEILDLRGNPKLHGGPILPSWAQLADTAYSKNIDDTYLCQSVTTKIRPTMKLKVDPTYFDYEYCICDRGTFGSPPECFTIPESQTIDSVEYPVDHFFNDTITDSWYGNQRMQTGLSTSFVIDKSNFQVTSTAASTLPAISSASTSRSDSELDSSSSLFTVSSLPVSVSAGSTAAPTIFSTGTTDSSLSVLMINITLFINLETFISFSDIIEIYEGNKKNFNLVMFLLFHILLTI
jgi:Leucine-rich repeat (LRR) protein